MATFDFAPSSAAPFQFQPVLDGNPYTATVPWVLFGARYYLNLVASDGTPIIYTAIPGSPTGLDLQALSWANGRALATVATPHGYKTGRIISLTVAGCSPAAYNGAVEALITGPSTFSYALAANPGPATAFGRASYDINMLAGVPNENGDIFTSTLVFREASQQFEVNP